MPEGPMMTLEENPLEGPDPAGPSPDVDPLKSSPSILGPDFPAESWIPVSGNGATITPEPTILNVGDGIALLYPGELNGIFGESESGKTWFALLAVREVLMDGRSALYLDFEGDRGSILGRLKAMGVSDEQLEGFWYLSPHTALGDAHEEIVSALVGLEVAVTVVDGLTELLALHELDPNSATDVAQIENMLLRPLREGGAAVLVVHHVPHDGERPLGSQHLKSMITGSAFVLLPRESGKSLVHLYKDRHHQIRRAFRGKKSLGYFRVVEYGVSVNVFLERFQDAV
jgi:predicted ATP-dependent serine protease